MAPFQTGATTRQFLICLPEGKRFQVSEKVVDVILAVRDCGETEEVSVRLSEKWQMPVSVDEVDQIVERLLKPRKLLVEEGEQVESPPQEERNTAIGGKTPRGMLLFKLTLLPKEALSVVTAWTCLLFQRRIVLPILVLVVMAHVGTYAAILSDHDPRSLALLSGYRYGLAYFLVIACVLWHEIGHASALRHYGATHGAIGFGLYLVFPIMYSDVSDAWRLPGGQRAVVDLGGIYFQAMTALVLYPAYLVTGDSLCLSLVSCNDALILMSLNPLLKFDGYWLVSDLLGVPNLRQRSLRYVVVTSRMLAGRLWPRFFKGAVIPDHLQFRFSTGLMLIGYGIASFAFLSFALLAMLKFAPKILSDYALLLRQSVAEVQQAMTTAQLFTIVNLALKVFFQTMPIIGMALMLWGFLRLIYSALKRHGLIDALIKPRQVPEKAVSRGGL